jgi:two-component system, chemotaxis family, chemotaxis protein CheY
MRILIVDDSAMMRALIRRVIGLTELPVDEVVEAADGAEALRLLESREFDLLLTDVNMPGMTGTELLREITRQNRWPNLVRVIISTDGSASRKDEAADLDVRCYLEKPFTPEVLRHVLSQATGPVQS